jgi:hypothetical protein
MRCSRTGPSRSSGLTKKNKTKPSPISKRSAPTERRRKSHQVPHPKRDSFLIVLPPASRAANTAETGVGIRNSEEAGAKTTPVDILMRKRRRDQKTAEGIIHIGDSQEMTGKTGDKTTKQRKRTEGLKTKTTEIKMKRDTKMTESTGERTIATIE